MPSRSGNAHILRASGCLIPFAVLISLGAGMILGPGMFPDGRAISGGSVNARNWVSAGSISTSRASWGWNVSSMDIYCQPGAVMIGVSPYWAVALNGKTATMARAGLQYTHANGRTLRVIPPDLVEMVQAGIVRPGVEAIDANQPLARGLDRAFAACP